MVLVFRVDATLDLVHSNDIRCFMEVNILRHPISFELDEDVTFTDKERLNGYGIEVEGRKLIGLPEDFDDYTGEYKGQVARKIWQLWESGEYNYG